MTDEKEINSEEFIKIKKKDFLNIYRSLYLTNWHLSDLRYKIADLCQYRLTDYEDDISNFLYEEMEEEIKEELRNELRDELQTKLKTK